MSSEVKELLDLNTNLQTLITRSEEIQKLCSDYSISNANEQKFEYDPFMEVARYTSDDKVVRELPMTDYSFSQLCAKLGISVSYMNKCKERGKIELIGDNINDWMQDFNRDLFIRVYDGSIRGILSQKYSVLDTPDILNTASDYLDTEGYKVTGSFLSPERLHLRAIPEDMLPIPQEDMFAGIQIDSSDVGRNTLSVKAFFYKLVCTNGLILPVASDLFVQRHIGIKPDDFKEGFKEGLKKLPMVAENFIAHVKVARNTKVSYSFHNEEAVDKFTADMKNKAGLGEEDSRKVIDLMQYTYGDTKWGLVNSLTEVAQTKSLEQRINLEKYAGGLLVA